MNKRHIDRLNLGMLVSKFLKEKQAETDALIPTMADNRAELNALIEEICDKVVQEVFNKALINW